MTPCRLVHKYQHFAITCSLSEARNGKVIHDKGKVRNEPMGISDIFPPLVTPFYTEERWAADP
jgi:hypothetical protein